MMKRLTALSTALLLLAFFVQPIPAFAAILDQQNTDTATNGFALWYFGNGKIGQSFTPVTSGTIDHMLIYNMLKGGSPAYNVVVRIFTDNTNSPSVTQVGGDSDVHTGASFTGSGVDTSFIWSSNAPTVTAGVLYWMVITTSTETNSVTDYVQMDTNGGSGVSSFGTNKAMKNSGGGWSDVGDGTNNMRFQEYIVGTAQTFNFWQFITAFF